ncbi:MAG: BamA/TamA family outer membrane protein [Myxococcales bacterium]|nr:BamA/TamA family outer membrane protein [Myxococcales bacterium]
MIGLAVALAAALGSPPPVRAPGPGASYAAAAEQASERAAAPRAAEPRAASRRRSPSRPAPGPRLSPQEEEPRGFRVRGHRILPVPTFMAQPSVGLSFGLRGRYVYRPPGETFDHARLDIVGRVSTKLVQDHTLDLQLRNLLHREEILDFSLRFVDDPVFPYPGIANFERLDRATLLQPEYRVYLRSIGGVIDYQQPFAVFEPGQWGIETTGYARWFVGARFAHDRILATTDPEAQRDDPPRWIDDGHPERTALRRGGVFGGLAWDSRDNGWSPVRGSLHDVSVELGGPWVASTQYWARFSGAARFYRPLGTPKLVLANQFLADLILGDAPLVSQGEFGGLLVREGIGGRDTGRGYLRRRFVGPTKLYASVELRVEPYEIKIRKRTLTPALKAFMDVGYVRGPDQSGVRPIVSGGPGVYVVWDRFFVFRVDAGFSPEGYGLYFTTNHAF